MRVLVCGGRNYNDDAAWNHITGVLEDLHREHGITAIIEGGAIGADRMGRHWADMRDVKCVTVYADWNTHGKAAGPIRNQRMINDFKPDLIVAFPGGKGTADMVNRAKVAGIKLMECSKIQMER